MEEYEVRQLYGRKLKSKLDISRLLINVHPKEEEKMKLDSPSCGIENVGETLAKDYSANILLFEGELEYCNFELEDGDQEKALLLYCFTSK